jgi:hypothetical protein
MPFTFALIWQASGDQTLYILIGAIVLCLIVLGIKFLRAMFEVITAPQASLGHHGQSDGFVHSMIIVLLGGLIGALLIYVKLDDVRTAYGDSVKSEAAAVASGATNSNYRQIVEDSVADALTRNFENFVVNNIVFFPLMQLGLWFLVSLFCFLFAKMLGGHCTMGTMAGALAYAYFFAFIANGLTATQTAGIFLGSFTGTPPTTMPAMSPLVIAGLVLALYSTILFFMAISQGGDLTVGQVIGVVIFTAIILGGASTFGVFKGKEAYDAWATTKKAYNPAIGGG